EGISRAVSTPACKSCQNASGLLASPGKRQPIPMTAIGSCLARSTVSSRARSFCSMISAFLRRSCCSPLVEEPDVLLILASIDQLVDRRHFLIQQCREFSIRELGKSCRIVLLTAVFGRLFDRSGYRIARREQLRGQVGDQRLNSRIFKD